MTATVQEALAQGIHGLREAGNQNACEEARFLLQHVLKVDTTGLLLAYKQTLPQSSWGEYRALLQRRGCGEPLQYILGWEAFCGLRLAVRPGVLIPRPDTRALVQATLEVLREVAAPRVWDVCCGSGAVGLAVKRARPDARVTLADISADCLALARQNAAANGVAVRVLASDLLCGLPEGEGCDALCANPPYIPSGEIAGLQREVRDFEPHLALDGGADGLDFYRRLALDAAARAHTLLLEVGDGQAKDVVQLLRGAGYTRVKALRDDYGAWRVVRGDCPADRAR